MRRRDLRKNAFILLFQICFTDNIEETKNIFFQELELEIMDSEKDFIIRIVDGVIKNIDEIDNIIIKISDKWDIKRISNIDLSILRIAIYEMKFDNETPINIVINEAIEIAKEYGTDNSSLFVNGILGKLASL